MLDGARIEAGLARSPVPYRIMVYETVPSTNELAASLARAGAPEGTVVLADAQTAGRGRGGRPWFSPPGVNLYLSVVLRPHLAPRETGVFSFVASLALADAIRELGLQPAIKWPNDLLLRRRKVAGTLVEVAVTGMAVEHVVLGLGVNVNVDRDTLRAGLGEAAQSATSLAIELGRPVDRVELATSLLGALAEWVVIHREQGSEPLRRAWEALDIVTGRRVVVRQDGVLIEGRARGVDADGHLEVEDTRGHRHRVTSGEVRLVE